MSRTGGFFFGRGGRGLPKGFRLDGEFLVRMSCCRLGGSIVSSGWITSCIGLGFTGSSIASFPFPCADVGIAVRIGQCPPQPPLGWVVGTAWALVVAMGVGKTGSKDTRVRLAARGLGCIWRGRPPQFSQCQWSISEIVSSASWDSAEK